MHKKSQVTVFIIIILFFLMMLGVMYYIMGISGKQEGERQINQQQLSEARTSGVKDFADSCIRLATSEGIELIGKQGGYIYESQGGMIPDPSQQDKGTLYEDYDGYKVKYGINRPTGSLGDFFFNTLPDYPWEKFPDFTKADGTTIQNFMRGYYGINTVPELDETSTSIKYQLEEFVSNKAVECSDFTNFEQQGLEISSKKPFVNVSFAEREVVFHIEWNITITETATGAKRSYSKFMDSYPVRIRKILEFLEIITDQDSTRMDYDIQSIDAEGKISSSVVRDILGNDDLIKIFDTDSTVLGKQYEFMFARDNRPSALYYIDDSVLDPACLGAKINFDSENPSEITKLKIENNCDNDYEIQINTIDPDEELDIEISSNVQLPHTVTNFDIGIGEYTLKIIASDGEYEDWQEIKIPCESQS